MRASSPAHPLPSFRRPAYLLAATALAATGLAACGGQKLPTVLSKAPEPAVAPPPMGTPAGTVVALGAHEPEGIQVDASSRYAVVATRDPGAVEIVDTATLRVLATVPIGAARHLELATGGEAVIVPSETDDLLQQVAIPSGSIITSVKVGRQPHDATDLNGTIVVADELGGAVTATRGNANLGTLGGLAQPGGVAQASGLAAVVDVRARLLDVYAVDPFRMTGRVAIGAGPTHAVGLGDGTVAVADTNGGMMFIVRLAGKPKVLATFSAPDQPYGLAVDLPRHRLWVTSTGDDTLRMFTLGKPGTAPTAGPTYITVQQPNSLAVIPATGQVIVAGATAEGQLEVITP
jgi:DNA-binding beta-propeller fold protein YncE